MAMKFAILYPELTKTISVIDSVSEVDDICAGLVLGWKVFADTKDGEVFFNAMTPSIYGPEFIKNNKEMLATRAKAIKNNSKLISLCQKKLNSKRPFTLVLVVQE